MTVYKGYKYVYQFNTDFIYLVPLDDQYKAITISANYDEDFSCFDFGPEICKQVEMGVGKVVIDNVATYESAIMRVSFPNPGKNMEILLKDFDDRIIIDITDITFLPNRSNPADDNERSAKLDNAEFIESGIDATE